MSFASHTQVRCYSHASARGVTHRCSLQHTWVHVPRKCAFLLTKERAWITVISRRDNSRRTVCSLTCLLADKCKSWPSYRSTPNKHYLSSHQATCGPCSCIYNPYCTCAHPHTPPQTANQPTHTAPPPPPPTQTTNQPTHPHSHTSAHIPTSVVMLAILSGGTCPLMTFCMSPGFLRSPRLATRLRTQVLYLLPVSPNSENTRAPL